MIMNKWFLPKNKLATANGVTSGIAGLGSFLGPIVFSFFYERV
jgi:hypothetical protein